MTLLRWLYDWMALALVGWTMVAGYIFYAFLFPWYRPRRFLRFVSGSIVVCSLTALFLYVAVVRNADKPRPGELVRSVFIVERGSSISKISHLLHRLGLIESPLQFQILAALRGDALRMKAGRYRFTNQMALNEILYSLKKGTTYNNQLVIPEGFTSWQIAAFMRKRLDMNSDTINKLVMDSSFAASLGIKAPTLEGYLFPDTYWFPWNATPRMALKQMTDRFREVYGRLELGNAVTRKMTQHQIVTMASIVEGEAVVDEERDLIAGVFYNRIRLRIPLGADPTVCYAYRKNGTELTRTELTSDHPYNTRVRKGLPPGPICSPGFASLQAALNPAETEFLYFMARYDGSGGHYFTTTFNEHLAMKKVAEATLKRRQVAQPVDSAK